MNEAHAVSLLEATHYGSTDLQGWVDELAASMRRLLPAAELVVGAVVQRHAAHWTLVAGDTQSKTIGPLAHFGEALSSVDPTALDPYYRYHERVYTHAAVRKQYLGARVVGDQFRPRSP